MASSGNFLNEEGPIAAGLDFNINRETSFYNNFIRPSAAVTYHKSLDFSNAGNNIGADNRLGTAFRQFHQTRIYVTGFKNMLGHGQQKSSPTYVISANLPETINYQIGSQWSAPLAGIGTTATSALVTLIKSGLTNSGASIGGYQLGDFIPDSLFNRAQTIQLWNGSAPLSMSITIPVIDDGSFYDDYTVCHPGIKTNFAEALEFLGSLCLPSYNDSDKNSTAGGNSSAQKWGFYRPPPSPIRVTLSGYGYDQNGRLMYDPNDPEANKKSIDFEQNYARIMIQLGGILLIDNCIITGIRVNYNDTKALIRHSYSRAENGGVTPLDYLTPLVASVTISFSTAEAVTSNVFSKMLWLRRQSEMGTGELNFGKVQALAQQAGDWIKQKIAGTEEFEQNLDETNDIDSQIDEENDADFEYIPKHNREY